MNIFEKSLIVVIIIVLLCSFLLFGCNEKNEEIIIWEEMPENTNPNLQYFRYYHESDLGDIINQRNNNIFRTDAREIEKISYMYEHDYSIFIMIRYIFFKNGEIHPEWEQNWENMKTTLAPYMDKIEGFYVDEPIFTGKIKESFHLACQTVRNEYPDKKMIAVLSYPSIDTKNADYFKYCTDLGYDLYESWNKESILEKITRLEEEVAIYNQNIWLIPKAFYTLHGINRFLENMDLEPGYDIINWIKGSYEIAVNDHRISAIYAFAYDDDAYDISLERFFNENNENYQPEIKELYLQIGKAVIANHS